MNNYKAAPNGNFGVCNELALLFTAIFCWNQAEVCKLPHLPDELFLKMK